MSRLRTILFLRLCAAVLAAEWEPPPKEVLTTGGLGRLQGKSVDDVPALHVALYRAWQLAVAEENRSVIFIKKTPALYNQVEQVRKANRAHLESSRPLAVWALLHLAQANVSGHRDHYTRLLREFADKSCVEPLKQAMTVPGGPSEFAAPLLAKLAPGSSIELLMSRAWTCPAGGLPAVVRAVGASKDPRAEPFLRRMALEAGKDAREEAFKALFNYKSRGVLLLVKKCLESGIDCRFGFGGQSCVVALLCRQSPCNEQLELLWKLTESNRYWGDQEELIAAAIARHGAAAAPRLLHKLQEKGWDTHGAPFDALREMGADAVPSVLPFIDHPVFEVRSAALSILLAAGDDRGLPILRRDFESIVPFIRKRAAWKLGSREGSEGLEYSVKAARDRHRGVRDTAVSLLAKRKEPEAVAELSRMLDDDSSSIGSSAGKALVDICAPEAREALKKFFGEGKTASVKSLLWHSDLQWVDRVRSEVKEALHHPSAEVRAAAERALRLVSEK